MAVQIASMAQTRTALAASVIHDLSVHRLELQLNLDNVNITIMKVELKRASLQSS